MRKVMQIMGLLSDEDVEWLRSRGTKRVVPSGTVYVEAGKEIDELSILIDGKLSIREGANDEIEIATLFAGEIIGEMSFVSSRPPSASVVAVTRSELLAIRSDAIRSKMEYDVAFAARFFRALASFLADRLRTTTSRFGYGVWREDASPDELNDDEIDQLSMASQRFDEMLRRLRTP
jgi:CRP-like cAMP-binding protein